MNFMEKYNSWLKSPYIDDAVKDELKRVTDIKKIEDMFYTDLKFGTGGLRGLIGPGTNRMNIYVVRRATQGLANYIKKQDESYKLRGVVLSYDSRHKSREFAMECAGVLSGNGIKAYVFDDLRPTPELSYAVRKLSAAAGIMITASHNPPEYNGYKVYGEDGAQISPNTAEIILNEINSITDFSFIQYINLDTAKQNGLFSEIGQEIDNMYINDIQSLILNKELIKKHHDDFKIIYTPVHGAGNIPVRKSLEKAGFTNIIVVKEQELPNPDFPTVKSPNPEEKDAFELSLKLAEKEKPDVILATDPDCDRLGVCVPDDNGNYVILTGNQLGALLTEYIISQLSSKGQLPENPVLIKTIVTSELGSKIAETYGVETINTLTGFKYIGEKINEFERYQSHSFVFGYEESYGYLAGTFVRDKDAVIAATLVCDMGLYYKIQGKSIYQSLYDIYKKFGFYDERLESITLKGKEGNDHIDRIMESLRKHPPRRIGMEDVLSIDDYTKGIDGLPSSDVIIFKTNKNSKAAIRPSGTEPKIKLYYSASGKNSDEVQNRLDSLSESFNKLISNIK